MANIICQAWKYDIECKYFYCSRYAFRLPLFIIDKEYTLGKLCTSSVSVTVGSVLARAGIKGKQAELISKELGIPVDSFLGKSDLDSLRKRLAESETFNRIASGIAVKAFGEIKRYFIQECNMPESFALVDSGWLGSLQESFFKIYQVVFGKKIKLTGYYFGMFMEPDIQYGNYLCYLFHPQKNFWRIIFFNNNLFECICSADHGMTIGYEMRNNQWYPRLEEYANEWDIKSQLEICLEYTGIFIRHNNQINNTDELDKFAFRLLKKFMYNPSKEEALLYGGMWFWDDTTNRNSVSLATSLNIKEYLELSSVKTLIKRMFGKTGKNGKTALVQFWLAGSAALSEKSRLSVLMKIDIFILNLMRYVYWCLKNIDLSGLFSQ
jgi:hypothetical protein